MYIDKRILEMVAGIDPAITKKRTYIGIDWGTWDLDEGHGKIVIVDLEGNVVAQWCDKIERDLFIESLSVMSISKLHKAIFCPIRNNYGLVNVVIPLANEIQRRKIFYRKDPHRTMFEKIKDVLRIGRVKKLGVNFSRRALLDNNIIIEQRSEHLDPRLKFLYGVTLTALMEDKVWKRTHKR